jgi:hypothetical protein
MIEYEQIDTFISGWDSETGEKTLKYALALMQMKQDGQLAKPPRDCYEALELALAFVLSEGKGKLL